jgi:predicted oxidoreductase (fatty acid repression mutant protein)
MSNYLRNRPFGQGVLVHAYESSFAERMSAINKRKRRPREDNLIHRIVQIVTNIPSAKSVDKLRNLLQFAFAHDDIWASLTQEKLVKARRLGGFMTLHDYCLANYLF